MAALLFIQIRGERQYALFQQMLGRNRSDIGIVGGREVAEGMHTYGNPLCFGLVDHLLYALITVFGEFRIPVEMPPVEERAAVVDIFEAGYFCLVQDHVEVIFREVGDQVGLHAAREVLPHSPSNNGGEVLFHFDLADTCQGICVLTAEESDLCPFDRAVLTFYGENQRFLDLLYLAILLFISSASGEMEYGTV